MRFVSLLLFLIGIVFDIASASEYPTAPDGFVVEKIHQNVGPIAAMTVVDNDLYYISAGGENVVKLSDRNGDQHFDARSNYLIGFDRLSDITSTETHLFIADKNGIWRVSVNRSLIAPERPIRIARISNSNTSIAVDTENSRLYVGTSGRINSIDLQSGRVDTIASGSWTPIALAVSPNGGLWTALVDAEKKYIAQVADKTVSATHLTLPPNSSAQDLLFWPQASYPTDWPAEWKENLLIALDGDQPGIGKAQFTFGDIGPELPFLIDGFSEPSRIVGKRDVWGAPNAMATLTDGRLIFADQTNRTLWVLNKNPVSPTEEPALSTPEPEPETNAKSNKNIPPAIIRGSSIQSVSGLENGSALESDELLRRSTQPENQETDTQD